MNECRELCKQTEAELAALKKLANQEPMDYDTAISNAKAQIEEKIRAGMEVSELMKRLTGRNYSVFVDIMESVDDLANVKPTGQVIMARCVKGAALSVRPVGQPQAMPKAA